MKKKKSPVLKVIIVLVTLGIPIWGLMSIFSQDGPSNKEKAYIIANGIQGTAALVAVERTGTSVNNIHQYAFTLRVQPDSGRAFEIVRKKLVDPIYMPNIKEGMHIPVFTVPGDEEQTLVLWEKVGVGEAF